MNIPSEVLIEAVGGIGLTIFAFFARSYFAALARDLAKLEGKLDALQADIRANTVEMAGTTAELKAVWRYIDGAKLRASDNINGGK